MGAVLAILTAVVLAAAVVVAHELGHALCARAHGLQVTVFARSVFVFGFAAAPVTAAQNRSVACAGPLAAIVYGLVLVGEGHTLVGWAGIVLFGVAQLLPLRRFDGGHILHP